MLSSTSNANQLYAHRAFQSKRHAQGAVPQVRPTGAHTVAAKNTANDTKLNLSAAAMAMETPEEFENWVQDPANYTKRKINGTEQLVPYTCSLTCNVPTEIYWAVVKGAAGDKGNLSDGALTDYIRGAIWVKLGYTQQFYDDWAAEEKARVNAALRDRMSGMHSVTAEKNKALVNENATLAQKLAELQEQLAALMAAGAAS